MQGTIGRSENELTITISELQAVSHCLIFFYNIFEKIFRLNKSLLFKQLQNEVELRYQVERELADLKNRSGPPPVTPRGGSMQRSPSPPKMTNEVHQQKKSKKQQQKEQQIQGQTQGRDRAQQKTQSSRQQHLDKSTGEIYLPEYCPMTLQAVKKNANHLVQFKKSALGLFENDLDELGIEKDEGGLSDADFKLKMKEIRDLRKERASGMPYFNELRGVFAELSDKFAHQKMFNSSSLRSSLGNRVTFNKNVLSKSNEDFYGQEKYESNKQIGPAPQNTGQNNQRQRHHRQNHHHHNDKYAFKILLV